jgi:hypothetical protein
MGSVMHQVVRSPPAMLRLRSTAPWKALSFPPRSNYRGDLGLTWSAPRTQLSAQHHRDDGFSLAIQLSTRDSMIGNGSVPAPTMTS